jgi:Flp pilus assembly pilin Flp
VAIGALFNNGNGSQAGHVRIYKNISGTWTQVGADIDGEAAYDWLGYSISLSSDGSTVAIGAWKNDGNGTDAGHVRVYKNINGTWTQVGADIDGEAAGDNSGSSVSLNSDGNIVAIGAEGNDGNGSNAGHVRIYKNISGSWIQVGADIDGESANDGSGVSVSLSSDGSTVAIGAEGNDGNGSSSGHVRIYKNISGSWIQVGADIDGEAAGDRSGKSVSLSSDGSTVAIGAHWNGPFTGHVRIYKNISGTWTQVGTDIDGEAAGDQSGWGMSLSSDGSIVGIGAWVNDGNGTSSGHVRVYNIESVTYSTDTITSCGPYTWIDGVTYSTSNYTATDTLTSATGCDSIVSLHLTIPNALTGNWTQVGSDIDGEAADDRSGYSVSISSDGNTVAIGAFQNDGNGSDAGHVRIYKNISGSWTQVGADIDGEAAGDESGISVALSSDGSTVAIGAPYNDDIGSNAGHVRIYKNVSGTWTQVGADIDGEAAGDQSGRSVALSSDGSIVAIGAYYNDGNGSNAGHVRIYNNVNGTWTQVGADIDGEAANDQSGMSVSLSSDGNTVAIGATGNDANGSNAGHVRIYNNVNGTWTQVGADIDGEAANDVSGSSVSLSSDGSTVAIGAYYNDGNGTDAGHVRVYKNISGTWTQVGSDIDGEAADDRSGISVSLSNDGSTVAIGAFVNDGNGTNSGHVRVYKNINGVWTQVDTDIDGESANDRSGYPVALSSGGNTVAIGAYGNDGNGLSAGHVRVYNLESVTYSTDTITSCGPYTWIDGVTYTTSNYTATDTLVSATGCDSIVTLHLTIPNALTGNWTQVGADIDGEAADDQSGRSVSLSSDGSTVAIGAPYNDGNGSSSGHVRIYKNMSGTWTQQGADIDGEAAGDESGISVALSSDGSTVAIGATGNAGNGYQSGHVRIYKNTSGSWTQVGADINGEAAYDWSGWSVSLSSDGSTVAIGALYNDGNGSNAGHVRIYKNISGTWTQQGADIDGEAANDLSGYSVSLSSDGSTVAIGAYYNDGNGTDAGHVRVYKNISGTWTQVGADIDGEAAGDYSGASVSLSSDGSTVAIGASRNDGNGSNAGHVRIYKNISGTWTQVGADIDGEAAYDSSGRSVSLSSDGSTVAIGALYNDGNGSYSGHVRIYKNISGSWTQQGADIDGEAADDYSGRSVSLSSNGSTVAIGAYGNDGNGSNAGHVRVYNIESSLVHTTDTITSCGPYTWIDGVTYSTSNYTATDTLLSAAGCDSAIVTLHLSINSSNTGTDTITACDSYTWIDGNTYTASNNTATYTLTNAAGCDSVVTLDLTINSSNTGTDVITACDSYTWIDGNTYTASNNTATYTLTNAAGCDSVVTLDLTINSSNTGTDVITACDSYTWIDGLTYTSSNNTATYTLTNAAGCDSVVTLDLTINSSNTGTDVITACDSYTWIDGNTYTASNNTVTYTLTNAAGCDSVVTLDLTINSSNTGTDVITACDSYTWIDGNTYTASNDSATYVLNNVNGCDSVVTLDLTIESIDASVTLSGLTIYALPGYDFYQWYECTSNGFVLMSNETNDSISITVNGDYAVMIDNNNCSDTSDCVTVNNIGLRENTQASFKLFPNPTQGMVKIERNNSVSPIDIYQLQLVDSHGKLIQNSPVNFQDEFIVINIEDYPAGVYQLTLKNQHEVFHEKISKVH